ncbi:DUF6785 family protein [Candidatus Poribacteria bacterium]
MSLSLRALLLGILFVVLICFIVSYAELVIMRIQIGVFQLSPAVLGVFFFIIVINRALGRIHRRMKLSPSELMVIYSMMLLAAMTSSRGLMEMLIPPLVSVNYFANETNEWADIFFKDIKPELVPFDITKGESQPIAKAFYENVDPDPSIPWGAWIPPLITWSIPIILIFFGFMCLASIISRQWVDNEKLAFPLVQLPLEIVRDSEARGFFSNKLMWLGFAIPAIVFSLNGLHNIFPAVPLVNLRTNLNQYFTEKPFSAMYRISLNISFAAIGFFYLLTIQLLFSLWFFFVMIRIQDVLASVMGKRITNMPLFPARTYIGYQVAGAYFVLVAYWIYVSLPYLRDVVRSAFTSVHIDDSGELLPYKVAGWGLIISFTFTTLWCWWAGLSLWFAVFELVIYMFVVAIVMARSVAESGMLVTEASFRPIDLYVIFQNKSTLGRSSMAFLSLFDAIFVKDQGGHILTGFMDSLRFSDGVKLKRRSLLLVFGVGMFVTLVVAASIQLYLPYRYGANYMHGYTYRGNPRNVSSYYASVASGTANSRYLIPFFAGMVVTGFLAAMRALYWWWPLHPLGYALPSSWTMSAFWFPVLIAWSVKSLVMKYGGVKRYIKLKPFFLGMIFGEFSMAALWVAISWLTKAPTPYFPWN